MKNCCPEPEVKEGASPAGKRRPGYFSTGALEKHRGQGRQGHIEGIGVAVVGDGEVLRPPMLPWPLPP